MSIIINPGTFEMSDATLENAEANMDVFALHCGGGPVERRPEQDHGGRFGFAFTYKGRERLIDMPGWPLARVTGEDGGSIFGQPRLYVDGSSWLWGFAVSIVVDGDES